jgi:hypothetical protein
LKWPCVLQPRVRGRPALAVEVDPPDLLASFRNSLRAAQGPNRHIYIVLRYIFRNKTARRCAGDGVSPQGALFEDTSGNFYKTTNRGGTNGTGTVFEILLASGAGNVTSMTLTTSVNPASAGEPAQFTVNILSPIGGPPTGNVTFSDGATILGTVGTTTEPVAPARP